MTPQPQHSTARPPHTLLNSRARMYIGQLSADQIDHPQPTRLEDALEVITLQTVDDDDERIVETLYGAGATLDRSATAELLRLCFQSDYSVPGALTIGACAHGRGEAFVQSVVDYSREYDLWSEHWTIARMAGGVGGCLGDLRLVSAAAASCPAQDQDDVLGVAAGEAARHGDIEQCLAALTWRQPSKEALSWRTHQMLVRLAESSPAGQRGGLSQTAIPCWRALAQMHPETCTAVLCAAPFCSLGDALDTTALVEQAALPEANLRRIATQNLTVDTRLQAKAAELVQAAMLERQISSMALPVMSMP